MTRFNPFLMMSFFVIVFGGCASNEFERKLVYCSWSQDDSRWPVHKTNKRNYFIASALGAQDAAYQELTGGPPKFVRSWDIEGHLIEVQSNSYGIVAAFDTYSSCYLTPLGYSMRKVGKYTIDELIKNNFIDPNKFKKP